MKKMVSLIVMTILFGLMLVGIPQEIVAQSITSNSIIIPDFTTHNFQEEVTVTYNTNARNYTLTVPVIGNQSPGGWHYRYTIIEQSSGRQIATGSGGSVLRFITSFKDTGDTQYRLTLDSIDDLWGQDPSHTSPRSTLIINSGKSANIRATVFEHVNMGGRSFENIGPIRRENLFPWNMNDHISSILLQPATKITIYDDVNFSGGSRTFMNNSNISRIINLPSHNWNDRASALEVSAITGSEFGVNLFQNSHNAGRAIRNSSPSGHADLRQINMNDNISSIELYPNTRVILFEHVNFQGEQRSFENSSNDVVVINLAGSWWNDRASSYRAELIR